MAYTDNPVMDSIGHDYEQESELEEREYIECDKCGAPIYKADSKHDGDNYYDVYDFTICEDCMDTFRKECT